MVWTVMIYTLMPISLASYLPAGFMTYVVEPLFAEWARFSDTWLSQTMLGHLCLNKASWKALQPEEAEFEQDSGSRALPQGSVESWHCLASPLTLPCPALTLWSLLICSPSPSQTNHWFNLFNFNSFLFFSLPHRAIHGYLIQLLLRVFDLTLTPFFFLSPF